MSAPSPRCEEQVADALTRGARCVCWRQAPPAGPLFFEPTLLADVPDDALIMREETFGPVAAITPFDTRGGSYRPRERYRIWPRRLCRHRERRAPAAPRPGARLRHGRDQQGQDHRRADPVRRRQAVWASAARAHAMASKPSPTEISLPGRGLATSTDARIERTVDARPHQRTHRLGSRPFLPPVDAYGHACARRVADTGDRRRRGRVHHRRQRQAPASTPSPASTASMSAMAARRSPTRSPLRQSSWPIITPMSGTAPTPRSLSPR